VGSTNNNDQDEAEGSTINFAASRLAASNVGYTNPDNTPSNSFI
jgi:hypothetical protein